jgi:hypothetical protein
LENNITLYAVWEPDDDPVVTPPANSGDADDTKNPDKNDTKTPGKDDTKNPDKDGAKSPDKDDTDDSDKDDTKNPGRDDTKIPDATDKPGQTRATSLIDISDAKTEKITDRAWSKSPATPILNVLYGGRKLSLGVDFTLSYTNNRSIGIASVAAYGKGKYKGTISSTFRIVPARAKFKSAKAGKRSIKVVWARLPKGHPGITKWQIRYRAKGTVKWKSKTVSAKRTSLTIKKLKKGKRYEVRIRSCKIVRADGKKLPLYSAWSKSKISKKTKK